MERFRKDNQIAAQPSRQRKPQFLSTSFLEIFPAYDIWLFWESNLTWQHELYFGVIVVISHHFTTCYCRVTQFLKKNSVNDHFQVKLSYQPERKRSGNNCVHTKWMPWGLSAVLGYNSSFEIHLGWGLCILPLQWLELLYRAKLKFITLGFRSH